MFIKLRSHQAGDTIVEVIIAITVISTVLAGAFVTSNKSFKSMQDAQERGQAVKLVQSQLEWLRVNTATLPTTDFCFTVAGVAVQAIPANCRLSGDGSVAPAGKEPAYTIKITKDAVTRPTYTVLATWAPVTGSTQSNVTMSYRTPL